VRYSRYYILLAIAWIFTSMSPVSVRHMINFTVTCVCVVATRMCSELHVNITAVRVLCFIVHSNTKSHVKTFPAFFQRGVFFQILFPGHIPWDHYHCCHSVTEGLWVNALTVESFNECKQGGKGICHFAFSCHHCCFLSLKVLSFQFYVLVYFFR
jgi:hypothetical protein